MVAPPLVKAAIYPQDEQIMRRDGNCRWLGHIHLVDGTAKSNSK